MVKMLKRNLIKHGNQKWYNVKQLSLLFTVIFCKQGLIKLGRSRSQFQSETDIK